MRYLKQIFCFTEYFSLYAAFRTWDLQSATEMFWYFKSNFCGKMNNYGLVFNVSAKLKAYSIDLQLMFSLCGI